MPASASVIAGDGRDFPPHIVGRGTREAGEGSPRNAAEWLSQASFAACGRDPFDPMLRIGPLPHDVGKKD